VSTRRKSRSELGTHEVRVHVDHSGGRSRSDASRVLFSGRSQGLLENQGASRKEARKHRLTRGTSREKAKRCANKRSQLKRYAQVRFAGFGSQGLGTTEDVLGLSPVLPSRARRREVLRLEGESQSHDTLPRKGSRRVDGQRIGRHRGWSGVPSSDHENVRGRRGSVKAPRGPKGQEEFASSALKRCRSSGAPGRDRPKLTAANSSVDPPPS
jgi:hypothetical protein